MYELIKSNRRKSFVVFISMGLLLMGLGAAIGAFMDPDPASGQGAISGLFIAIIIWAIQSLIAFAGGDQVILRMAKAREVHSDEDRELYNIIEELSIASGLPMPKIYVIDTPAMNAFATGMNPNKSVVAITQGLRSRLNRQEIQAVMAHEMSHIYNRDVRYMTFASIMLGTIVIISEILLRSFIWGGSSKRSSDNKGGGAAQIIIVVVVILLAILAPILARMFYFSLSRKREYLADATSVSFTRDPISLANALEKISADNTLFDPGKMTAAMCINKPRVKEHKENLASTHPPIQKRIAILRAMSMGTDYDTYMKVYASVIGKNDLPKNKKRNK
ncbi:MAG: M48 family metallopeptidase [Bacteroidales bacterium]|jgi:heat shock protein HtpX|nr:M48 family metallopeptidase [Bacteroidales bacterium]